MKKQNFFESSGCCINFLSNPIIIQIELIYCLFHFWLSEFLPSCWRSILDNFFPTLQVFTFSFAKWSSTLCEDVAFLTESASEWLLAGGLKEKNILLFVAPKAFNLVFDKSFRSRGRFLSSCISGRWSVEKVFRLFFTDELSFYVPYHLFMTIERLDNLNEIKFE